MKSFFSLFVHVYFLDSDRISPSWGSLVRLRPSTAPTFLLLFRNPLFGWPPCTTKTHLTLDGGGRYQILTAVDLTSDTINGTETPKSRKSLWREGICIFGVGTGMFSPNRAKMSRLFSVLYAFFNFIFSMEGVWHSAPMVGESLFLNGLLRRIPPSLLSKLYRMSRMEGCITFGN